VQTCALESIVGYFLFLTAADLVSELAGVLCQPRFSDTNTYPKATLTLQRESVLAARKDDIQWQEVAKSALRWSLFPADEGSRASQGSLIYTAGMKY